LRCSVAIGLTERRNRAAKWREFGFGKRVATDKGRAKRGGGAATQQHQREKSAKAKKSAMHRTGLLKMAFSARLMGERAFQSGFRIIETFEGAKSREVAN
jgi:hypothetical protein